jgi:hypothetical protein
MDWKEGAKWIAVIALGGVLSSVLEMVITRYVKRAGEMVITKYVTATASSVAHEEVERTLTAAVQRMQAQAPRTQQVVVQPQRTIEPNYTVL